MALLINIISAVFFSIFVWWSVTHTRTPEEQDNEPFVE